MPALAEPITLVFHHEPLTAYDIARVHAGLDEAHIVVVVTPTWSVLLRCGSVMRIEIDMDDEGVAGAMQAVGSSSVWAVLDGIGMETSDEVVVELVRANRVERREGSSSKLRFRIEIRAGSLALVKKERRSNATTGTARSP